MAKVLSQVETEVRMYLDEAQQTDFLNTEVDLAINRAYHDVAGRVMEVYENFYETTTPFTYAIVLNQQEYTIDSSLIKVTRVEINYNPGVTGSTASRALPIKEDEIRGNMANTSAPTSFMSAAYYLHGDIGAQKIGFLPIPTTAADTGSGKSISVWGIALPSDLASASDNVNIPYADRFVYLVALRAAAQLLRKGQQEEGDAMRYIQEFEGGVKEMMTFLKERQADDIWGITDALMESTDFETLGLM